MFAPPTVHITLGCCDVIFSRCECNGFLVALAPRHHCPGRARDLVVYFSYPFARMKAQSWSISVFESTSFQGGI